MIFAYVGFSRLYTISEFTIIQDVFYDPSFNQIKTGQDQVPELRTSLLLLINWASFEL